MGLEAAQIRAMRYRRPWYWLVVLAVAASFATWLIYADARSRLDQTQRQFESSEQLRLQRMEQRIDDYFVDAIQLVSAGTEMLSSKQAGRGVVKDVPLRLYRARRNPGVYGLGAFYGPFAFDAHSRLFSVYVHPFDAVALTPADHLLPGAIDQIVYASNDPPAPGDYTNLEWYQAAVKAPGATVFVGPYTEERRSFISAVKAFYSSGHLLGVFAVDTLTVSFKAAMQSVLAPGDIAYVASGRTGRWVLGTSPLPNDPSRRIDRAVPLRYSRAFIHISADAAPLFATNQHIRSVAFASIGVVWISALLFGIGIVGGWRSREATLALELQRARLENELAVGKKIEGELRNAAYTDGLTGLPNRAVFIERAAEAIAATACEPRHAVFFIDLDRFNMINDTLGHFAGDELLKMIAARLRAELPPETLVARLGGDEFLVLAEIAPAGTGAFADIILASLHHPMLLAGGAIYTAASIGVVALDSAYATPEELLRDADIAMYAAKGRGRGCYAIFDAAMRQRVANDSELDNDLRRAIERREFVPYYQPIVSIETREIISFEALVRWNRPDHGVVAAADFIEYAESHGLVDAIDAGTIERVCHDAAALFERFPEATVAVNVSAGNLTAPGMAARVEQTLLASGVAPERLKLEVTETAIMTNADLARATLDRLRLDGIQIVLDDFGAGRSSLAYLHRLPIAGLKIDRSFVAPLASDSQAVAIIRSIVALAKSLDLYTVAEGVETAEQLDILSGLGVGYAQGFFFAPALGLAELLQRAARSNAG
jgi:diguanylate cyclase (GGDEF)-like protein